MSEEGRGERGETHNSVQLDRVTEVGEDHLGAID